MKTVVVRLNRIFATPLLQHPSVLWDNVRCVVKNDPISLN